MMQLYDTNYHYLPSVKGGNLYNSQHFIIKYHDFNLEHVNKFMRHALTLRRE